MADSKEISGATEKDFGGENTLAHYEDGKLVIEDVRKQEHGSKPFDTDGRRNLSIATDGGRKFSTGGSRRLSEWDAMRIAKEGGVEVDEEIELLEMELQENPITSHWYAPVIKFNDPRHFTYVDLLSAEGFDLTQQIAGSSSVLHLWEAFFPVSINR